MTTIVTVVLSVKNERFLIKKTNCTNLIQFSDKIPRTWRFWNAEIDKDVDHVQAEQNNN